MTQIETISELWDVPPVAAYEWRTQIGVYPESHLVCLNCGDLVDSPAPAPTHGCLPRSGWNGGSHKYTFERVVTYYIGTQPTDGSLA